MAFSLNDIYLGGNLTADPEQRVTANGIGVCDFTLAVNRDYKNAGGGQKVDFIKCQAWRHNADYLCNYFKKGDRILIKGELHNDQYKDAEGNNRYSYCVQVLKVLELKSGNYGGERSNEPPNEYDAPQYAKSAFAAAAASSKDDDDLPF